MCLSWPYSCGKISAISSFTEMIITNTLNINIITIFNLYSSIYYRDKVYALFSHFCNKFFKIRERLFINCKIFIPLHIIYIKIYCVKRNTALTIFFNYFSDIVCCTIAPTALLKTKSPFWCNIASADKPSKLSDNIIKAFSGDYI